MNEVVMYKSLLTYTSSVGSYHQHVFVAAEPRILQKVPASSLIRVPSPGLPAPGRTTTNGQNQAEAPYRLSQTETSSALHRAVVR